MLFRLGDTDTHDLAPNTCMRILTGAPTPRGADVVIMQENTTTTGNQVTITKCPKQWNNIRRQGEEVQTGVTLLKKGTRLDAVTIGLALAASVHHVLCLSPLALVFSQQGMNCAIQKMAELSKQDKSGEPTPSISSTCLSRTRYLCSNMRHCT